MFAPTRGFSGMADSIEPCTMLWADPCCHDNEIWANLGNFFDKIAYKSACMPDRPDMFGPTWGDDQGAIFVAMATTFALCAESNRLPACLIYLMFTGIKSKSLHSRSIRFVFGPRNGSSTATNVVVGFCQGSCC